MPLPVNFEQLVKLPPADGYPTTIKASDLMRNFAYCDLVAGDGVSIVDIPPTTAQHPQRRISVTPGSGEGDGWYGRIEITYQSGGGAFFSSLLLDFEDGRLKAVQNWIPSLNDYENVPGTESSPGDARMLIIKDIG